MSRNAECHSGDLSRDHRWRAGRGRRRSAKMRSWRHLSVSVVTQKAEIFGIFFGLSNALMLPEYSILSVSFLYEQNIYGFCIVV